MHITPRRALTVALLAVCSTGGAATALAQTSEGDCGEGCPSAPEPPQVDARHFHADELSTVLRHGVAFLCGYPSERMVDTSGRVTMGPEVDCRIDAKIVVPAKVAHYIGLHSTVLADGVAGNRTDHYEPDRQDLGRAYFLQLTDAVKARLKARHIRALGVLATGKITVKDTDQIMCDDAKTPTASCTLDYGRKANVLNAPDGEMVCWPVMPWWVAIKSKWGQMCPRPITA